MGGGSSKSSASNVHNDNDIMASDSAVVIGENGEYTSTNLGMGATLLESGATDLSDNAGVIFGENGEYTSTNLGMGATLLESGATDLSDNTGLIFRENASYNSGIQMGEGASLVTSSMDERTSALLDNAMTYMYANTENILELAALQNGGRDPIFMNPEKEALPTKQTESKLSTGWKVGLLGAALLGLMALNGDPS